MSQDSHCQLINTHNKTNSKNIYLPKVTHLDSKSIKDTFQQLTNINAKSIIYFLNNNTKNILLKAKKFIAPSVNSTEVLKTLIDIKYIEPTKLLTNQTKIYWNTTETPLGLVLIATLNDRLCALSFLDYTLDDSLNKLQKKWPAAALQCSRSSTKPFQLALDAYFEGKPTKAIPIAIQGTPFQVLVWKTLLSIPEGYVLAYSDIAGLIIHNKAHRAVGTAVGQNPISCLIPCHRVISANGELGNYHWGVRRKLMLLIMEQARCHLI